jgi:hypothetical protein
MRKVDREHGHETNPDARDVEANAFRPSTNPLREPV